MRNLSPAFAAIALCAVALMVIGGFSASADDGGGTPPPPTIIEVPVPVPVQIWPPLPEDMVAQQADGVTVELQENLEIYVVPTGKTLVITEWWTNNRFVDLDTLESGASESVKRLFGSICAAGTPQRDFGTTTEPLARWSQDRVGIVAPSGTSVQLSPAPNVSNDLLGVDYSLVGYLVADE